MVRDKDIRTMNINVNYWVKTNQKKKAKKGTLGID